MSFIGASSDDMDKKDLKAIIIFDGVVASAVTAMSIWRWSVGSSGTRHDRVQQIMDRLGSYIVFYQSVEALHTILSTLEKHKVVVRRRKECRRSREIVLRTEPFGLTTPYISGKSTSTQGL